MDTLISFQRKDFMTKAVKRHAPIVSFLPKGGKIQFNAKASELLGISEGSFVDIGNTAENARLFWFRATKDETCFPVHAKTERSQNKSYYINCKPLVEHVQDLLCSHGRITMQIGTEKRHNAFWGLEKSYKYD